MKNPHLKEDFGHNKISFNDFVRRKNLGPKTAQRFKQFLEDECGCADEVNEATLYRVYDNFRMYVADNNFFYPEDDLKERTFENGGDGLFDYVLNESSLKENECSLEWLLDKAYVSEYRMVGKNSAEVRVRHTPELLTSDSMAARFGEDIPDGYKLEVDFLGEDPILGRNFDIYEVQLLKD